MHISLMSLYNPITKYKNEWKGWGDFLRKED